MVQRILEPEDSKEQSIERVDGRLGVGVQHFVEQVECILNLEVRKATSLRNKILRCFSSRRFREE